MDGRTHIEIKVQTQGSCNVQNFRAVMACVVLTITVRCPYGDCTMSLRCNYGLRAYDFFFKFVIEATMPVNPYDDRKVSLRRAHGNGDLDIVRASYARRKANVTEA